MVVLAAGNCVAADTGSCCGSDAWNILLHGEGIVVIISCDKMVTIAEEFQYTPDCVSSSVQVVEDKTVVPDQQGLGQVVMLLADHNVIWPARCRRTKEHHGRSAEPSEPPSHAANVPAVEQSGAERCTTDKTSASA